MWRLNVDVPLALGILDGLQRYGRRLQLRLWFLHGRNWRRRWERVLVNLQRWRLTRQRHLGSDAGRIIGIESRTRTNLTRKVEE